MVKRILIVDDDAELVASLTAALADEAYQARGATMVTEVTAATKEEWDLVLLSSRFAGADGFVLLRELRERRPEQLVIVLASETSAEDGFEAIKLGAHDYLRKPFAFEELLLRIRGALEAKDLRTEVRSARARVRERAGLDAIVGRSAPMREVHELVRRVAASDCSTVLVTGESGSGKDLVAKAIHYESTRADGPFMTITCTAIAEQLLESELFGHEKGAFTNAVGQRKGLLELAHGGTVFLDEIGDMSLSLQAKLLRFLQEKTLMRLGGSREIKVDVRIIAATHQPLPTRVEQGAFREDLFYRLKVVDIVVPPLRSRPDDVMLLCHTFVDELNRTLKRSITRFTPEAEASLVQYPWPGNVRELRNAIERAMILGQGDAIGHEDLPAEVRACAPATTSPHHHTAPNPVPERAPLVTAAPHPPPAEAEASIYRLPQGGVDLERLERELLLQAITETNGNKTQAGRLLGLNRYQVRHRLEKYGLREIVKPSATEQRSEDAA